MKTDLILLHAPSVYDFRKSAIMYGPVSDLVPSGPIFEMYPVGFATLAEYAARAGFEVRVINLALLMLKSAKFDPEALIRSLNPGAFGIDLHWLPHAHGSIEVARLIKKHHPDTPVIFGGYSATYFAKELLEYPEVDFVLRGDSTEEPLVELLRALRQNGRYAPGINGKAPGNGLGNGNGRAHGAGSGDGNGNGHRHGAREAVLRSIPNLSWRDKEGGHNHNPIDYVPEDMNHVALDYRHAMKSVVRYRDLRGNLPFDNWLRYPITAALTCRGCTCTCVTCGASAMTFRKVLNRRKPAYRDPELLARDVIRVSRTMRSPIFMLGDVRQAGDDYADTFLSGLKPHQISNQIGIEFFRPPPGGFFEQFSDAVPHYSIEISLESHDETVRRAFGKRYTNAQVEEAIGHALRTGCERVDVYFMTGLPEQTPESVRDTVSYCEDLYRKFNGDKRLIVFISPMAPFLDPGSQVFEEPEKHGYRLLRRSLEEHRQALVQPSWKYTLNYETRWLTRDEQVQVTYDTALGLNSLKARVGVIDAGVAGRTAARIERAKMAMAEIDRIASDRTLGAEEIAVFRKQIEALSASTVCEKSELEWPTSVFNFRPIGILRAILGIERDMTGKGSSHNVEWVRSMFEGIASRYDLVNRLLSFGLDRGWRSRAVEHAEVGSGSVVLDACTGTGNLALLLQLKTGARVVGVDFSQRMLSEARRKADAMGMDGELKFQRASVDDLPFADGSFDAVTIGFGLRNIKDRERVLQEFLRVTRPHGRLVCLEFSRPVSRLLGAAYSVYLSTVIPVVGRLLTGDGAAYRYLSSSIRDFPGQRELCAAIESAGWSKVRAENLLGGVVAIHTAVRDGSPGSPVSP